MLYRLYRNKNFVHAHAKKHAQCVQIIDRGQTSAPLPAVDGLWVIEAEIRRMARTVSPRALRRRAIFRPVAARSIEGYGHIRNASFQIFSERDITEYPRKAEKARENRTM